MHRSLVAARLVVLVVLALLLARCGGDGGGGASDDVDTSADAQVDAEAPEDIAAPDVAADVAADATAVPSLDCAYVLASGERPLSDGLVVLRSPDEPEAYRRTSGFQVDLRGEGRALPADVRAVLSVDGQRVAESPFVFDAVTKTTSVAFDGVTLPHAPGGVGVTVSAVAGGVEVAACVSRPIVDLGACPVELVREAEGCLTSDEDTAQGFQHLVTVRSIGGACDRVGIVYAPSGGTETRVTATTDENGEAQFLLTLFPTVSGLNGATVEVTATASDSANPERAATAVPQTFTVDTQPPVIHIEAPAESTLGPADDEDRDASNGIQVTVRGTVEGLLPADGRALSLTLDGLGLETAGVDASARYELENVTFATSGAHTLSLAADDACGGHGETNRVLQVATESASLAVLMPVSGATLPSRDDADPSTPLTYETAFVLQGSGLTEGTTVVVRCRRDQAGSALLEVGRLIVAAPPEDGLVLLEVALRVDLLGTEQSCMAATESPLMLSSAEVLLRVALPAPRLTLVDPADGDRIAADGVVAAGAALHLAGRPLQVHLDDEAGLPVVTAVVDDAIVGDAFTEFVALDLGSDRTPDGRYRLWVDAADSLGNLASDQPDSDVDAWIALDRTAAELAFAWPPATLRPETEPAAADTNPDLPGYQTEVAVEVRGEDDPRGVEVCVSKDGQPLGCAVVEDESGVVRFPDVSLQPGASRLQATARDVAGNESAPETLDVVLALDAPRVLFVAPAPGLVTGTPSVDVTVEIEDPLSGEPLEGADAVLRVNGAPTAIAPVVAGARFVWEAVALAEGPNRLQATATAGGTTGYSDVLTVTYKTGTPSLAFTWPTDGEVLSLATSACAAGVTDCRATVILAAEDLEDGSTATLDVACGAGAATYEATALAGSVRFDGVVLVHGSPCTLTATATDTLGQTAEAGPVTVRADRVAPAVVLVDLPEVVPFDADADAEEPGIQLPLTVEVGGAEAGRELVVRAVNAFGETTTKRHVLVSAIPEGVESPVTLGLVTLPSGFVEVSAELADAAGNTTTARQGLFVNGVAPDVRLVLPADVANVACTSNASCAAGGVCTPRGCAIAWGAASRPLVRAGLQGIPLASGTLRVCSDSPDTTGAACATAGFREAARVDVTGDVVEVSVGGRLPEGFQTIVVEAQPVPGTDEWVSSRDNPSGLYRTRTVFIDTVLPELGELALASDFEAPLGVLNIAEQPGGPRQFPVRIAASEPGTATFFVNGLESATVPTTGAPTEATLTLREGTNTLQVRLADLVGNSSGLIPATPLGVTVDTRAPRLTFLYPDRSPILAGQTLDVRLSSDATGQTVTLADSGLVIGEVPVDGAGLATFPHATFGALAEGQHELTAEVRDAANNGTRAVTRPAVIDVDTVPPELTILSPAADTRFGDDDDADPVAGGFQVRVRLATTGASVWSAKLSYGCLPGGTDCADALDVGSGAAADGETSLVVTVPIVGQENHVRLAVDVRDAFGNGARGEVTFAVELVRCAVELVGLPGGGVYNNALCAEAPGSDCASVSTAVTVRATPACLGVQAVALYDGATLVARTTELVAGEATFDVTLDHGDTPSLSARVESGGATVGESGAYPLRVDLTDPVLRFLATDVTGFETPASDERVGLGLADDQIPATTDRAEIHVVLSAADDALPGGRVVGIVRHSGSVTEDLAASNVPLPTTIETPAFEQDYRNLALPVGDGQTVVATVADAAGNEATTSFEADVDLVAPAAVTLEALAPDDVNPRRPSVALRWVATGEDGAGEGAASAYDIRYSFLPIDSDTAFDEACPAAAIVPSPTLPAPGAPGSAETFTLSGPDARDPDDPCRVLLSVAPRDLHVAVRAVDDVGNVSPLTAGAVVTAALGMRYADITSRNVVVVPAPNGDPLELGRRVWPAGDLDADGLADMAFGGHYANALCIVYGHTEGDDAAVPSYEIDGPTGAHHVCMVDTIASFLGTVTVGGGDLNGDGIDDLVVGMGSRFPYGGGPVAAEVRIHLGRAGEPVSTTPNVRIRGMKVFSFVGLQHAIAGNFNGDTRSGRPVEDLVVSSDYEGPTGLETGAVYIVPGNGTWTAATNLTIDVTSTADRATHNVARIGLQGAVPVYDAQGAYVPPLFGTRVTGAGNLLADEGSRQYDDVAIAQRVHTRGVYIVRGRPLAGAVDILVTDPATLPATPTGEDARIVRLRPEPQVLPNTFGDTLVGGVDLDGGGVPDLVVAHPANAPGNNIHFFRGESLRERLGTTVWVSLASPAQTLGDGVLLGANGWIIQGNYQTPTLLGDIDDEGGTSVDLAYNVKSTSAWGEFFVRLNVGVPSHDGARGLFPFVDLAIDDPNGSGALCFGNKVVGVGDVNGDGFVDMLVGGGDCGRAVLVY